MRLVKVHQVFINQVIIHQVTVDHFMVRQVEEFRVMIDHSTPGELSIEKLVKILSLSHRKKDKCIYKLRQNTHKNHVPQVTKI